MRRPCAAANSLRAPMQPHQHQSMALSQHQTSEGTAALHVSPSTIILHPLSTPPRQQSTMSVPSLAYRCCQALYLLAPSSPTFILAKTSLLNMPLVLSVSGTLMVICRAGASHGVSLKLCKCQTGQMPLLSAKSWPWQHHGCNHVWPLVQHQRHPRLCQTTSHEFWKTCRQVQINITASW